MSEENLSHIVEQVRAVYSSQLLAGRLALVTGASRGIGRAVAVAFGAVGAKVVVNYAGNEAAAAVTAEAITQCGAQAVLSRFNVAAFSETQEALKGLEKELGAFDIIVNNAGVSKDNLIVKLKEEEWDANIDINLKGCFNVVRATAMSMMRKRAGKIINLSSVIALNGNAGQVAYGASKAGILGLTKSLARELAPRNIQVNAIAPGFIATDMTASHGEKLIESVLPKIPLERLGDPIDIALAAVFLASPASQYVTGQTLSVDGGMHM